MRKHAHEVAHTKFNGQTCRRSPSETITKPKKGKNMSITTDPKSALKALEVTPVFA